MANPFIANIEPIIAAGIDPKTGLPMKAISSCKALLKENLKKVFRVKDMQAAANSIEWNELPCNITSQELEKWLYYKGQLCLFHCKDDDKFYFMPCALDGSIDFYGRWNYVHPIPISYGTDDKQAELQAKYLSTIKLKCIYDIKDLEELKEMPDDCCVILHDYTKQFSQMIIPRQSLNDPIVDFEAEMYPMARTSLISSSGIKGVRVNDADQEQNVRTASKATEKAALAGDPWIPIVGNIEFQELTDNNVANAQEFLLMLESLNNFRLSTHGISAGNMYQKKEHMLQDEQDANSDPTQLIMDDRIKVREHFCEVANALWGLNMSAQPKAVEQDVTELPGEEQESEGSDNE